MTILPMLDCGDIIYRSAAKGALERLDVLYQLAIRFATNAPYRTHQCTLYSVSWSSLYTRQKGHWLMLIYKPLLGLTPPYLIYLLQPSSSTYNTRTASHILFKGLKAYTSLGYSSFQFAAACDWNELQQTLDKTNQFLSQSLHSKTQSWTLLLKVVAALCDVLLSLSSCPLCSCLCPIMLVSCFVLLLCCVVTMLCCHVLFPCYVVVLGLSLCSGVFSLVVIVFIFNPRPPSPQEAFW